MDKISKKEEALESLQHLITEREAAQKRRRVDKSGKEEAFVLDWTLTQLHIVATIKEKGKANNTSLSENLKLSKPAITKAVKKLLQQNILMKIQQEDNKKEVYYLLTESGEKLALVHNQLHEQARIRYLSILDNFNIVELETIIKFLNAVTKNIKQN